MPRGGLASAFTISFWAHGKAGAGPAGGSPPVPAPRGVLPRALAALLHGSAAACAGARGRVSALLAFVLIRHGSHLPSGYLLLRSPLKPQDPCPEGRATV